MPIHTGQDKNGNFYQWGKTGKKYYFKPGDEASCKRARGKAEAQQTAIYSSGWKGDNETKMKIIKVKTGDADPQSEYLKKNPDARKLIDNMLKERILDEYKKLTEKLRKTRQEVEKEYHDEIGSLISKLSFKPQDDKDIKEAEFLFRQQYNLKGTSWR